MDRTHRRAQFTSVKIECKEDGYVGQELRCNISGSSDVVAKLIFWDADGQYSVETIGEVPLTILEELIAETKRLVLVR